MADGPGFPDAPAMCSSFLRCGCTLVYQSGSFPLWMRSTNAGICGVYITVSEDGHLKKKHSKVEHTQFPSYVSGLWIFH